MGLTRQAHRRGALAVRIAARHEPCRFLDGFAYEVPDPEGGDHVSDPRGVFHVSPQFCARCQNRAPGHQAADLSSGFCSLSNKSFLRRSKKSLMVISRRFISVACPHVVKRDTDGCMV